MEIHGDVIRDIVGEVLFGPAIEDIQAMIEPDEANGLAMVKTCDHANWGCVMDMCYDCGVTREQLFFGH